MPEDETRRLTEENRRLKNECDNLRAVPWFVYVCTFCDWTSGLVRSGARTAHDCPAIAEEREACAREAELESSLDWVGGSTGNAKGTAIRIAAAIRAR